MRIALVPVLLAATLVTGCATGPTNFPVEVTRYRVDDVERGTVTIEPDSTTLEGARFQIYASAVSDALTAQGYTVLPAGQQGRFVVRIGLVSDRREVRRQSPVNIGLGGDTWSGGGRRGGVGIGLGGGISFPIGKGQRRDQIATVLTVKINTRDGNQGVWEGTAKSREDLPAGTGNDAKAAPRLANALFSGFPGESGRTIEVK